MALENQDNHFNKIYWYISGATLVVLLYVVAITFIPVPEKSQRFVDISLAFLLGWISSNSQYLTGATATSKKADQKTTTEITPEGQTTITQEPINPLTNEKSIN